MKQKHLLFTTFLFISIINSYSQNTRENERNDIGWYNYFGTFKLNDKFSIHSEYNFEEIILLQTNNKDYFDLV